MRRAKMLAAMGFHALRCAEAIRRDMESGVEVLCNHAQQMRGDAAGRSVR